MDQQLNNLSLMSFMSLSWNWLWKTPTFNKFGLWKKPAQVNMSYRKWMEPFYDATTKQPVSLKLQMICTLPDFPGNQTILTFRQILQYV